MWRHFGCLDDFVDSFVTSAAAGLSPFETTVSEGLTGNDKGD
jgi:hypothetical protein